MRRGFHESGLMRAAALWAVAFILAMKILVAPGMMPVADRDGLRITLCTGAGPVDAILDLGSEHDDHKSAKDACPFGVMSVDALAAGSIAPLGVEPLPFVSPAALPPLPARAPPVASLPPATGPPSFA
jgi:hypothetical protein